MPPLLVNVNEFGQNFAILFMTIKDIQYVGIYVPIIIIKYIIIYTLKMST